MVKKAFLKSIEAVIAIFISVLFLVVIIPSYSKSDQNQVNLELLRTLNENEQFRNCVILQNRTCINQTLRENIPESRDFNFNISDQIQASTTLNIHKTVFVESIFISGNTTYYKPTILRVYYWAKTS